MISVVLPTYNEAECIKGTIEGLLKACEIDLEVVVVDDNSPDGTASIVESMQDSRVRVIKRTERGLASALARGIKESSGDLVLWMDADDSMPPARINGFIQELLKDADVVVGSRYVSGGRDDRPLVRTLTSRAINLFANLVLNWKVRDYDSGFVAARKEVFAKVPINESGYGEYCIEFLYKCTRAGFKVKEIPYVFTDRTKGTSKTGDNFKELLVHGWNYGTKIIKLRFGGTA